MAWWGVVAMLRTHRLADDLAWLPPGIRRSGAAAAAAVWGGSAVVLGGALVAAPALATAWQGMVLAGAGLALAGQRVGRAVFQRGLRRLARGELPLAELAARDEGELVVVRGRIEAAAPIGGWLTDTACVYRRLEWEPDGPWISEAAVDFALVDDAGHRVLVQAGGARWMVEELEQCTYPIARFDHDGVPTVMRQLARRRGLARIRAAERCLDVGDQVQVVGYKTASADAGGEVVDYRLPPQRATLRSGPELPLVITRIAKARRSG